MSRCSRYSPRRLCGLTKTSGPLPRGIAASSFARYASYGTESSVTFVPDESVPFREHELEHEHEHGRWLLGLSSAQADALARTLAPSAGTYAVDGWPKVRFVVVPTHIRDQHGDMVATIG